MSVAHRDASNAVTAQTKGRTAPSLECGVGDNETANVRAILHSLQPYIAAHRALRNPERYDRSMAL